MKKLTSELRELCATNPDVALILETFQEIDQVYQEVLEATGEASRPALEATSSAKVTVSFRPSLSSSGN